MIKPVTVASVLTKPGELRDTGTRPPNNNRFSMLRDRSRSVSISGRLPSPSPAAKRRAEDEANRAGKAARIDRNAMFLSMETVEKRISHGKKNIEKLKNSLVSDESCNGFLKEFLGGVIDTLDDMVASVEAISSVMVDGPPDNSGGPPTVSAKNGQRQEPVKGKVPPVEPTPSEVRKAQFVSKVKEAEKSVLVFGLDLGRVPTMNTGTLARKVTEDITTKASVVEGKTNGRPSEDTVAVLEDTLSMMKGLEFFGKVTKPHTVKNSEGVVSTGTYHTLPVKLIFKDKDAKARAEKVLRTNCKVNCTTPYPMKLRSAIKRTIEAQKVSFPNEFIQVKVDPEAAVLRVSRRADGKWTNNTDTIPLTEADMDLSSGRTQELSTDMDVAGSQPSL